VDNQNASIVLNRFSLPWVGLTDVLKKSKKAHIDLEVENSIEALFRTFGVLMADKYFVEALNSFTSSFVSHPLSIKHELQSLRKFIETILEQPDQGIVQLDSLVHLHDKLAEKAGEDALQITSNDFKSFGNL